MLIGDILKERLEVLGKPESSLTFPDLLDEVDQQIIRNLLNNEQSVETVDSFIIDIICSELHCQYDLLMGTDKGNISSTINLKGDDQKAKQAKIAIGDYLSAYEFVTNIE